MADLDLRIKQTVRGCQWKKESEEERMMDLLYHATIYYEICKYIQESEPATLTYEMVIEKAKAHEHNVLEYKDHQASHGGANSAPSYNNPLLTAHALTKDSPVAMVIMAIVVANVANLMSEATAPHMGRPVTNAKVLIIPSCVSFQGYSQPSPKQEVTATVETWLNGEQQWPWQRRWQHLHFKKKMPKKPPKQNAYEVIFKNSVLSEVTTTSGGERENHGKVSSKMVLSGPEEEGTYNRFSCFAVHSKMSQSTNAMKKAFRGDVH